MIRLFDTHRIRPVRELDGLWDVKMDGIWHAKTEVFAGNLSDMPQRGQ